jgi:hypothetical protein
LQRNGGRLRQQAGRERNCLHRIRAWRDLLRRRLLWRQ